MRGNRYVGRGGDPMKSKKQKRKEMGKKLAKTNRVQRLKRRLGKLHKIKTKKEVGGHVSALMESFVMRRKAERKAEREKRRAEEEKLAKEEAAKTQQAPPKPAQRPIPAARRAPPQPVKKQAPLRVAYRSVY
jgi:hypothetical protein